MGFISLEKLDNLFWLGRYTERVYTTLGSYFKGYDEMIDRDEYAYRNICDMIGIPDVYGSSEAFLEKYPYDEADPNSIISNLNRAFDNAIVMRASLGTATLSYIQLALYDIAEAKQGHSHITDLQKVCDHLLAFWGCVDDKLDDDEPSKSVLRTGRRCERIDLYLAFRRPAADIKKELKRLKNRLSEGVVSYNQCVLDTFESILDSNDIDYPSARALFSRLVLL